jgi:hypothetical protein
MPDGGHTDPSSSRGTTVDGEPSEVYPPCSLATFATELGEAV